MRNKHGPTPDNAYGFQANDQADTQATAVLLAQITDDREIWPHRVRAADALCCRVLPANVEALVNTLRNGELQSRAAVCDALQRAGRNSRLAGDWLTMLTPLLYHLDGNTRSAVVWALRNLGGPGARRELERFACDATQPPLLRESARIAARLLSLD